MGSGKDVVPTPEEVAADEAVKQEIAEMEEVLNHGPSRPSVVSKSKFSKWETVEANRMKTEAFRAELDALEAQRLQSIADFVGMVGRIVCLKMYRCTKLPFIRLTTASHSSL